MLDRLIQQALNQVLSPIFESTFSEHSYGFRPGRNAHQAVRAAQRHVLGGRGWVVGGVQPSLLPDIHLTTPA